jgi:catechol 2,3-dioxygenase-like lactoylglutathione lyase family enzyme
MAMTRRIYNRRMGRAMITGAHAIIYSTDADKDRVFFRDVLGMKSVDSGGGWLIFKLPPAELAMHPGGEEKHELYLIADDIKQTVKELKAKGVKVGPVKDQGWGLLATLTLPGGGALGLYEAKHPRP